MMITTATHAATSFNILGWVSIATGIVGVISGALAARGFRILKRTTPEPPPTTLPELFKQQMTHHNPPASQDDERDRVI